MFDLYFCGTQTGPYWSKRVSLAWTLLSDPASMSAATSGIPNPLQSVASRKGLLWVHHLTVGASAAQLRSHPMARTAKTAKDCTDRREGSTGVSQYRPTVSQWGFRDTSPEPKEKMRSESQVTWQAEPRGPSFPSCLCVLAVHRVVLAVHHARVVRVVPAVL